MKDAESQIAHTVTVWNKHPNCEPLTTDPNPDTERFETGLCPHNADLLHPCCQGTTKTRVCLCILLPKQQQNTSLKLKQPLPFLWTDYYRQIGQVFYNYHRIPTISLKSCQSTICKCCLCFKIFKMRYYLIDFVNNGAP